MSFNDHESSRSRGAPDTLYKFTFQNQVFSYTDAESTITFAGTVYQPVPIDRSSVAASGTLDKSTLTVDMQRDLAVAELFRVFPPSDVVNLVIFQGHAEYDNDFLAVWTGRIINCSIAGSTATLTGEPVSTSMRRPGLRRRYQYGCPHYLYGPQCRAIEVDFTRSTTVSAVLKATVTLASGWNGAFDKVDYIGGKLTWETVSGTTEIRTIIRTDPDTDIITISGRGDSIVIGQSLDVTIGCNHLTSGCTLLNNINNFGGQDRIPLKNPVGLVNQYD